MVYSRNIDANLGKNKQKATKTNNIFTHFNNIDGKCYRYAMGADADFVLKKEEIGVGKNGQEDEDNHRLDHAAGDLFDDVKAHDDSEQ